MENFEQTQQRRNRKSSGNLWAGLLLLIIGGALLARQFGMEFPRWIYSWPTILILVGLFIGAKNNFRDYSWLIMVTVGGVFLLDRIYPELPIRSFAWPVIIIGVGLIMIFAPRKCRRPRREELMNVITPPPPREGEIIPFTAQTQEERLDVVAVFGGIKKRILSKNFKGGEIVAVFGGAEVNLIQSDFSQIIEIEVIAIFGGVKLSVPSNWEIRSETVAILGGIDDKRGQPITAVPEKILVLKGTTLFGGIEINSY